jgi:hypothetical protein
MDYGHSDGLVEDALREDDVVNRTERYQFDVIVSSDQNNQSDRNSIGAVCYSTCRR